jgi:hypothetical protein
VKLLTPAFANPKMRKNKQFKAYLSYILHLSPSNVSGVINTCPRASKGCRLTCLNTAGRGQFTSIQLARIRKTVMLKQQPDVFRRLLIKDLEAVRRKALKERKQAVVRLNGTSDLDWSIQLGINLFREFPDIQFYDYTKVISRLESPRPKNYYLIFSRSEVNKRDWVSAIKLGVNVAVVFQSKTLPKVYAGRPVLSGDDHDFRFLDRQAKSKAQGYIVGLLAKGKAKRDVTGFAERRFETKLSNLDRRAK